MPTGFWTEGLVGSPANMNATLIQRTTAAAREAAALAGILHFATDTWLLSRDNGATWDSLGTLLNTVGQTITGIKTFASIPVLPGANPTSANQAVRKQYVDDLNFPVFIPALAGFEDAGTPFASGNYSGISLADAAIQSPHMNGQFPFTPSQIDVVVTPAGTGNVRMQFEGSFGQGGELQFNHTDSLAYADYAVTVNILELIDISAAFTLAVAGDFFGLEIFRDGSHANDTIDDVVALYGLLITP